ncbi:MAG: polysaccharide biosynthesis C-terminal domain-containing protein, partial [Candidatus Omnitrophica bacterium]|nr:polysaccharide biosynthesis C-terminal domain-containing protein [Candidatus Omnitrophota bacterium]
LNVVLMFPMKLSGIALASSIASLVNITVLATLLEKRLGDLSSYFKGFFPRIFITGLGQGLVVWGSWIWLAGTLEIVRLVVVLVLGSAAYWFLALLLRLEQPQQVLRALQRRTP